MNRSVLLPCVVVLLGACGKSVPVEIKPTLDSIRDDARKVAEAAAKTCAAAYASGQFYVTAKGECGSRLLPGQTMVPSIPSPAKGTPLESNPNVVEVETSCSVPVAARSGGGFTESCGAGLDPLRRAFGHGDFKSGNWDTSENTCKSSPSNCEMVEVPSRYAKDAKSVDLTVVRPMIGGPPGGSASVRVVLARK